MQRRVLGSTGVELSVVGFGGIVVMNVTDREASRFVERAVERGINYFDVAPSYGNAEQMLGPALEPFRRDVFLACKTGARDAKTAREELSRSLQRLRTDHVDLYQFHGVSKMADVEAIFAPDGAIHAFREARDAGLVKYIGFSAHDEQAGLAMLERFEFDSVLFPVNAYCWNLGGFGSRLLEGAISRKIGALALKTLARRPWNQGEERAWPKCWYCPIDDIDDAERALRFTLSRGVTAAVSPSHAELLDILCDAAERIELAPDSPAEPMPAGEGAPVFSTK